MPGIPGVTVHSPVRGFLLVAHVLLPEQVVARVIIILDRHVERAARVHIVLYRHLDIDRADVRVGDGGGRIPGGFSHPPAMIILRRAPLDLIHVRSLVHRHFAVVGAAEDQLAHLSGKPFDEGMKSDLCHVVILAFLVMKFVVRQSLLSKDVQGR